MTKLSRASKDEILFTKKCLYPGILQTGLLNKVKCIIVGNEVSDWISLQLLMLLLCKYKNFSCVKPAKTLSGGKLVIELSLRSIFLRLPKLWRNIKSFS